MADKKEKKGFKAWWAGLKGEYSRIIWPDKPTVVRQTITVIVVTIIIGILIALIDSVVQLGIGALINK
ncbi:MAG: preprotein translocase subunit SecE [Eubacterium sp.]|nr:preprotein translocase subunit SecE [Eubacterium sp.]